MATLEKPKRDKKRSKQRQQRLTHSVIEEDVEPQQITNELPEVTNSPDTETPVAQPSLSDLENFDLPTTSKKHTDIVSHECFIASGFREQSKNTNDDVVDEEAEQQRVASTDETIEKSFTNISLHDELSSSSKVAVDDACQDTNLAADDSHSTATDSSTPQPWTANFETPSAPTAPVALGSAATTAVVIPTPTLVNYPDLTSIRKTVETKSQVLYQLPKVKTPNYLLTNNTVKPFTEEQLKEIYLCTDLELVKQFELEFLMNSLLDTYDSDPLYIALLEYYNLQSKLTMNLHDVKKYRAEAIAAQEHIWVNVPITKTFSGRCGDNVEVKETFTYDIAQVDGKNLKNASAAIKRLFDLVSNTYTTNLISAKIHKIKIDEIINEILLYPQAVVQESNQDIALHKNLDAETLQLVAHLRRAISIMFSFARRLSPSKNFDNDLKKWLSRLVSLHLLVATKEDHWFLLYNVLRCPSGIRDWAAAYVQIPCTYKSPCLQKDSPTGSRPSEIPLQLNSPEISHCVAMLQILLLPIKKRNDYLKAFTQSQKEISDPIKEERWILVDSDGEDSHTPTGECVGPKESDLIALLNQVPFEKLFTSALSIEKFLNDYIIEADLISANQMLKVVAFFSELIKIFGEGMLTYNNERYKQLAKRLGRLIRHSLQYIADYHELFIRNNLSKDPFICERITVELNALLIKACSYIYRSRNLGTWQYFSSLPFTSMEPATIWQIFYYLNVGFPIDFPIPHEDYIESFNASDFWIKFNVANADSSPEDLYYLLQAFFEMANERDKTKDWELIKSLCLHIFNIGFINEPSRDVCYKTARDMLLNMTLAYEDLMSCLLLQLKIRFSDIENSAFLFKSLPLENWKPGMDSFEILSNWLLHYDFKSPENILARVIIGHLNWGFDCDGRLFLPHNIHVRMACLVSEALTKHAPEVIGASGISESVRQVSSLIDFKQSTKDQFSNWCWSVVYVLRLHLMDQSVESIKKTLQNPTEPLMFVPDLERIDVIYQGVTEMRPLAMFVSICVSLWGHSIPLICQKGFEQMKLMLSDHRHAAVIRCIELIVPLFLETPETLANCENFHAVLNNLLNADKTYLKMAKDMLYANSMGPVLEHFDNMIHHQITNYTDYGLVTPLNLINVWLNCFTSLPNWQNTSVVYLLNNILRVAYQFPDARLQAIEYFRNYYKDCDEWKGISKTSTLKNFFGSNQKRIPELSPCNGWLSLILLEIEYKMHDSLLWDELLRQLVTANGKPNLDSVLKKTTSVKKIPAFSASMLVIYKYANLTATMDVANPVFPIIHQKFFELFLSRVPLHYDQESFQNTFGVSDKFYEYNVPLMKKIKASLKTAEVYYNRMAKNNAADEALNYFYRNCENMMKTYTLWLEETSINKFARGQPNLPPQYNNGKLSEILNGNTQHWTEFIYLPSIRKLQRQKAEQWARKCCRLKAPTHLLSPLQPKPKKTPIQRIKEHLSSYDKKLNAPKYIKPETKLQNNINGSTIKLLKSDMKTLGTTATKFNLHTGELNSINRNYLDVVLNLYKMVPYNDVKHKGCTSVLFNLKCSSPAQIVANLEQIQKNDDVARKIEAYRERHNKLVDEMLEWNVDDFAQCIENLGALVRILVNAHISNSTNKDVVTNTGIDFFYHIVAQMTEINLKFQPTNDFCSHTLAELGVFIQDNQEKEGLNILELTLKRPDLLKMLSTVFVPYRTQPQYFIKMYKFLIDSHLKRCDTKIIFVLLSKFDMISWLETFQPKLYDITQLLQLILRGLECWSQPDSSLLQDLFQRHLVHIFNYDFPQHYGEVMQMVLDRISDQKLKPIILLDLLNSLLARFSCEPVTMDHNSAKINELSEDFACRQNLFNLKAATDTVMLFARHFQKERLHHGLHGLYPKHKDYCKPLSIWFSYFGHLVVVTAICTYQELLADQISDIIFGCIIEMYAPWLVAYNEQTVQQPSANWIRQLTENGKMLLPWSENHAKTSKIMIQPFVNTFLFVLNKLPASNKILNHTFGWYTHHFAIPNMESYIQSPIHEGLAKLPWEVFKPAPNYIDMLYDSLHKYIPESHAMLGHIFIRIDWKTWIQELLPTWPQNVQIHVISHLLTIFVKISFEPNIHMHTNTSNILEDAINYPWYIVEYAELENLFKWFITSVEPSIILKLPNETNYADRAVLDLLRLTSGMMPDRALPAAIKNETAKRILYTRSMVRMLRSCAAKNQKLLATKDGLQAFNMAFLELINTLDKCINAMAVNKTLEEQKREALNFIIEIVLPMQTQSEETSNIHVDALIRWQAARSPGNLLTCQTLHAIGHMKGFISGVYALLESSIAHYFKESEATTEWHSPTWLALLQILSMSLDKLELMPIMQGPYFFTLHIFILYRLEKMQNFGDQITFLQDLSQLVENLKTSEYTEPRMAIVWGVIISRGCKILAASDHAKKPLLMLARHLYTLSTKPESWGEGLLGAIGLKRDNITNKRKVLTRCLACIIFSLFPDTSFSPPETNQEFHSAIQEMSSLLANKKFLDVKPLIVKAIHLLNEHKLPHYRDVPHLICRVIALFYENSFLTTIPEIWDFDFKLS